MVDLIDDVGDFSEAPNAFAEPTLSAGAAVADLKTKQSEALEQRLDPRLVLPPENSWMDETAAITRDFSLGIKGVEALTDMYARSGIDTTIDEGHDPLDYFRQTHPDMFKEITTMDLPGNRDMMGALAFSQNEATSQFLIAQMKDQLEHRDNLLNAGVSNWLVGGFSGLLLDGIATLGVGTVLNVAKAPFMVSRVARIAQLERLAAEGTAVAEAQAIELHKAASVGMFYGGADVGLQDVVDYDIGVQDYLIGIGAGALLGTGAGALINRWNKSPNMMLRKELHEAAEVDLERRTALHESAGAMATRAEDVEDLGVLKQIDHGDWAGSVLAKKLEFGKNKAFARTFRSPRRRVLDYTVKATKSNNPAMTRVTSVLNRILRQSAGDVTDTARTTTVEQNIMAMQEYAIVTEDKGRRAWNKLLKDHWGIGRAQSIAGNNQLLETLPEKLGKATQRKILAGGAPDEIQVKDWAADLARNKSYDVLAEVNPKNSASQSWDYINKLKKGWEEEGWTPEQIDATAKTVDEISRIQDAFYEANWQRMRAVDLVSEEQYIPHYRSQVWNVEAITRNEDEFRALIYQVYGGKKPEEDWVNSLSDAADSDVNLGRYKDDVEVKEGEDGFGKPTIDTDAGETWDTFAESNPATAMRLADEWSRLHLERVQDNYLKEMDEISNKVATLSATRARRAAQKKKVSQIDKRVKALDKKLARMERKLQKTADNYIMKRVDDTVKALKNERTAYGFVPDDVYQDSRFFKERKIILNGLEFLPRGKKFLVSNEDWNMRSYANTAGRQIAFKENFAPLVKIVPGEKFDDFTTRVKDEALRDYRYNLNDVEGKIPEGYTKETYRDEMLTMEKLYDDVLDDVLRRHHTKHGVDTNRAIGALQSLASATTLGFVLASMLQDVAVLAVAGPKLRNGFQSVFRSHEKIFKEMIDVGAEDLAFVTRGAEAFDHRIIAQRMDYDGWTNGLPGGGLLGKAERGAQTLAQLNGYASFMHQWNKKFKAMFGYDLARQQHKDIMGGWDAMPDAMKAHYARVGLGKADFEWMSKQKWRSFDDGRLLMPDGDEWLKTKKGTVAYTKFKDALRNASDEGMIAPSMGDRPVFAHHPLGRVMFTFTSFAYTVGNRMWVPMVQKGLLHKDYVPMAAAILLSTVFGVVADGWREAARKGDEGYEEWKNKAFTDQGFYNLMKRVYLRSNYSFGMSSTAADLLGHMFGDRINSMAHSVTGSDFDLIDQEFARLKVGQGFLGAVGGPVAGMVGTIETGVSAALAGDWDKAQRLAELRTPLINTIIYQSVMQALTESME